MYLIDGKSFVGMLIYFSKFQRSHIHVNTNFKHICAMLVFTIIGINISFTVVAVVCFYHCLRFTVGVFMDMPVQDPRQLAGVVLTCPSKLPSHRAWSSLISFSSSVVNIFVVGVVAQIRVKVIVLYATKFNELFNLMVSTEASW